MENMICCNCEDKAYIVCVHPKCYQPAYICDWSCDQNVEDIKQYVHTHDGQRKVILSKDFTNNLKIFKYKQLKDLILFTRRIDKIIEQLHNLLKKYKQNISKFVNKGMFSIFQKLSQNQEEKLSGSEINILLPLFEKINILEKKNINIQKINIKQKGIFKDFQERDCHFEFEQKKLCQQQFYKKVMDTILSEIQDNNIDLCFNDEYYKKGRKPDLSSLLQQECQKTLQYYENVLKYNPLNSNIRYDIAECHFYLKNDKECIKYYQNGKGFNKDQVKDISLRKKIVEIYQKRERFPQAIDEYNVFIQKQPNNHELFYKRARNLQLIKKNTLAQQDINKCLQILQTLKIKNKPLTYVLQIFELGLKVVNIDDLDKFQDIFLSKKLLQRYQIDKVQRPKRTKNTQHKPSHNQNPEK